MLYVLSSLQSMCDYLFYQVYRDLCVNICIIKHTIVPVWLSVLSSIPWSLGNYCIIKYTISCLFLCVWSQFQGWSNINIEIYGLMIFDHCFLINKIWSPSQLGINLEEISFALILKRNSQKVSSLVKYWLAPSPASADWALPYSVFHPPPIPPVPVIANYCSFPSFSFGQALGKLQGKVLTHSEKVGWWKSLMVECVSIFWLFRPI